MAVLDHSVLKNKLHRLTERDSRLAHYFGIWGYF